MEALEASISGFHQKKPNVLVTSYDEVAGEHVVRLRKRRLPEQDLWSFMIGDVIHNFRVALDHLAFSIVSKHPGGPKEEKIAFPICGDSLEQYRATAGRCIGKVVPDDFKVAVQKLQPYNGRNGLRSQPLAVLDELENTYKHRRLLVTEPQIGSIAQIGKSDKIKITFASLPIGDIQDRAELYRWRILDPTYSEKDVKVVLSSYIRFRETGLVGGREVLVALKQIRDHIANRVFPRIEPFL